MLPTPGAPPLSPWVHARYLHIEPHAHFVSDDAGRAVDQLDGVGRGLKTG